MSRCEATESGGVRCELPADHPPGLHWISGSTIASELAGNGIILTERCRAMTLANQPNHLLTRCSLEAGHAQPNHIPSFTEEDRNGWGPEDCPGHGHRRDIFHANPAECPDARQDS